MSISELTMYLVEAVTVFVQMLTDFKLFGLPLISFIIFFGILSMVLVIVFRVKPGDLFDGLRWRK